MCGARNSGRRDPGHETGAPCCSQPPHAQVPSASSSIEAGSWAGNVLQSADEIKKTLAFNPISFEYVVTVFSGQ